MIRYHNLKRCPSINAVRTRNRAGAGWAELLATLVILAVLGAIFLPSIRRSGARDAARRMQCSNNLKQIGLALHNYQEEHGALPPAYTVDGNGQPLHSWRTLILPYLDHQNLYETIDLSKPWNHPANARAYAATVHAYTCPSTALPPGQTTSLAVVGEDCGLHPTEPRRLEDVKDGLSNTLLVMETSAAEAEHWMNPGGSANRFLLSFDDNTEFPHGSASSPVIQSLLMDGSVRSLPASVTQQTRRALTTIAGDDDIEGLD